MQHLNGQPPSPHAAPSPNGRLPVAVIGAGPVGLAAAAHLLERGLDPLILEAGQIGAGVATWAHVRVFSPWRHNLDAAAVRLLTRSGWVAPDPDGYPTGTELRERYLVPLAATPELAPRLRLGSRVVAVTRHGLDKMKDAGREQAPFELIVDQYGRQEPLLARAVIDASGTVATPNPLGASGIPAPGEAQLAAAAQIAYGMPDVLTQPERYAGRRVLVVGSGHSAMQVLHDLVRLRAQAPATEITWAIRRADRAGLYRNDPDDPLPARAALGAAAQRLITAGAVQLVTGVEIHQLRTTAEGVLVDHRTGRLGPVDQIVAATGFRPDLSPLRELRLRLDPGIEAPAALAPLIDPNVHSCNTVPPHGAVELAHPEPGFYLAGMKSYGRAPTFLMLTGYEQVRSIAAALAGDLEAARRVELVLPAGGACGTDAAARGASCSAPDAVGAAPLACCGPEIVAVGERPAGRAAGR